MDAAGAAEISVDRDFISGIGTDIEYDTGLIYATTGVVLDPIVPSVIGTFPDVPTVPAAEGVQVDAARGIVYLLASSEILVYDTTRFMLIDSDHDSGSIGPSPAISFTMGRASWRSERAPTRCS